MNKRIRYKYILFIYKYKFNFINTQWYLQTYVQLHVIFMQ